MRKKKYAELQKRIEREKKLQQVELAMEDKLLLKVKWKKIIFFIYCISFLEFKTRWWWWWRRGFSIREWNGKEKTESYSEKKIEKKTNSVFVYFIVFLFQ